MVKSDELITAEQAAERLGVSTKTVKRFVERGRLTVAAYDKPERGGTPAPLYSASEVSKLAKAHGQLGPAPAGQALAMRTPLVDLLTQAMAGAVPLRELPTLSFKEAARFLHWPETMLRKAHKDGELPGAKIGHGVRIWRTDLLEWVEAQRPGVQAPSPKRKR